LVNRDSSGEGELGIGKEHGGGSPHDVPKRRSTRLKKEKKGSRSHTTQFRVQVGGKTMEIGFFGSIPEIKGCIKYNKPSKTFEQKKSRRGENPEKVLTVGLQNKNRKRGLFHGSKGGGGGYLRRKRIQKKRKITPWKPNRRPRE